MGFSLSKNSPPYSIYSLPRLLLEPSLGLPRYSVHPIKPGPPVLASTGADNLVRASLARRFRCGRGDLASARGDQRTPGQAVGGQAHPGHTVAVLLLLVLHQLHGKSSVVRAVQCSVSPDLRPNPELQVGL